MLDIQKLSVKVEDKSILKDLSLNVPAGQVHVVMGANGCGKSTLLKTIAGHPSFGVDGGQVTYEADLVKKNLLEMEPHERARDGVFLSFQDPAHLEGVVSDVFYKTIYEEACKHQGAQKPSEEALDKMIADRLKDVGLSPSLAHRFMNVGFSGGEKKRNEIFQMLLLQPKLIMLDEIDSGLDVDAIKTIAAIIRNQKSPHTSFLVVTHYRRLLEELDPDKIHILSSGKITKSGGMELLDEVEKQGYDFFKQESQ